MRAYRLFKHLIYALLATLLVACAPRIYPPGNVMITPALLPHRYLTASGDMLAVQQWLPDNATNAVVIAVHGFNDYSHFFEQPGNYLKQHHIACYAYDQRGFGVSPMRGSWSGIDAYTEDLSQFIRLLKQKYPKQPLFVLGESMGGAVVIATMTQKSHADVQGIILIAPAVWSRDFMPWYQQSALWLTEHLSPWLTLSGKGLAVKASDNHAMLKAFSSDPLVIKLTRVETISGLSDLMDLAQHQAASLNTNTLLLYGAHDEIIPLKPTQQFIQQLDLSNKTIGYYADGYHMLLRDLNAEPRWRDMLAWIRNQQTALPSGADVYAKETLLKDISRY